MFVAQLLDLNGDPIAIDGLWALTPGNGGMAGSEQLLYFTAGPDEESHGLFGVISPVPEPATLTLPATGLGAFVAQRRRSRR
jgi:PEP-CTERM motif